MMSAFSLIPGPHEQTLWPMVLELAWYVRDARRLRGLPAVVSGLDVHAARARWVGRRLSEIIKGSANPEGYRRFVSTGVRWIARL